MREAHVVNLENSKNGAKEKEHVEELPCMVYFLTFLFLSSLAPLGRVGCLSNCVGLENELADAMVERTER